MINIDEINHIPILKVADLLGIKFNSQHKALCFNPNHREIIPSLSFNEKDNYFYCFGCCIGGNNIELVKLYLNLDFKDTLIWFKNNFFIQDDNLIKPKQKITQNYSNHLKPISSNNYSDIYEFFFNLLDIPNLNNYLENERAISRQIILDNNIKSINPNRNYYKELLKIFDEKSLFDCGLFSFSNPKNKYYFTFWNCIMIIPFYKNNKIVYFQGIIDRNKFNGKYIYLSNVEKHLFYIPKFPNLKLNSFYITEGIVDTLSFLTMGFNSIAILDATLTQNKLQDMLYFKNYTWLLVGDNDVPGFKCKLQIAKFLSKNNINFKVLDLFSIAKQISFNLQIKDINELLLFFKKNGVPYEQYKYFEK